MKIIHVMMILMMLVGTGGHTTGRAVFSPPLSRPAAVTYTVTSTADSGPGTLAAAMFTAVSGDVIHFDPAVFPPSAPATISLSYPLPYLQTGGVTIDASDAGVILDGSGIPSNMGSQIIGINSDNNIIRGLQVIHSPYFGIYIIDGSGNTIGGDRDQGAGPIGQGNLFSYSSHSGIAICGDSQNNSVLGNLIGVDPTGTLAWPNQELGFFLGCSTGTAYTLVEGNVISGNAGMGLDISRGSHHNTVSGNRIGVTASGSGILGNGGTGIQLDDGAHHNMIGGDDPAEGNIISGNGGNGILVAGSASSANTIQGNRVGIDADSTGGIDPRALVVADDETLFFASYGRGVFKSTNQAGSWQPVNTGLGTLNIEVLAVSPNYAADQTAWAWGAGSLYRTTSGGASWTLISSALPVASGRNYDLEAAPNYPASPVLLAVFGSHVYRSADGGATWSSVATFSNSGGAVAFSPNFASDHLALFATPRSGLLRSIDSGLTWTAVTAGPSSNYLLDIAIAANGQTAYVVSYDCNNSGVYRSTDGGQTWTGLASGPEICWMNGKVALSPNFLTDATLLVMQNAVTYRSTDGGTNWTQSSSQTFGPRGMALAFSPDFIHNQTIYQATSSGIFKSTDGGQNWGWAGANLADAGNQGYGINVSYAGQTYILDNVVGNNSGIGIRVAGTSAANSEVRRNLVGVTPDGAARASNGQHGMEINAPNVIVDGNTISASGYSGLMLYSPDGHHATVTHNRIGTDATGQYALPNASGGVAIYTANNTLRDNLISGNWDYGIATTTDASDLLIAGNLIGLDADGVDVIGNEDQAVDIDGARTTIGGDLPADRNRIAGSIYGIYSSGNIRDIVVANNEIYQNNYGLYFTSSVNNSRVTANDLHDNTSVGIQIASGCSAIQVDQNRIHHNGRYGIYAFSNVTQTRIQNNEIYANQTGVLLSTTTTIRNTISQNSIHDNSGLGIQLASANTGLAAPIITAFDVSAGTASGTACANCTVELFSDQEGEGRVYEGSAAASAAGAWTFDKGGALTGPQITATGTDAAGNTSEFGLDFPAQPPADPAVSAPTCGVTNQTRMVFQGTAQLSADVVMGEGSTTYGGATANDQNEWSFTNTTALPAGAHTLQFTAANEYGTSSNAALNLAVNTALQYNPVGVTFSQLGVVQHPRDSQGCAVPANPLSLRLWPGQAVTVSVPAQPDVTEVFVEVNSARTYLEDSDADGVYTGAFTAPGAAQTTIVLSVTGPGGTNVLQIGATIDPDGYVSNAQTHEKISGATVTLYAFDTARSKWVQWDAGLYAQLNPQVTGEDGYFAFFTPPGQYQLVVEKDGYPIYTSSIITVTSQPVRYNVALRIEGATWDRFFPLVQ